MISNFEEKIAIVTGGASGIGRKVVELLADGGANVISIDLEHACCAEINYGSCDEWHGCKNVKLDVSDYNNCVSIVDWVRKRVGRLDILVNCAGIKEQPFKTVDQDIKDWQRIMDVNLGGTYGMSKTAASLMKESDGGAIVNVSSITGLRGFRASNGYGVSKSAIVMLTRTMASDLAPYGIRVNAVAPGFIDTPMIADWERVSRRSKDAYLRRIPLRRFGTPSEVALPILMLCNDSTSYITGVTIPVDGGWVAFGGV